MPDEENNEMPIKALKACGRCGNPFLVNIENESSEIVCDNCINLENKKRALQFGVFDNVIEIENKMEDSINEMKNTLTITRGKFNKDFYLNKIKKRAKNLLQSVELIEKIEETNDDKHIDEYKKLFEKMKRESS